MINVVIDIVEHPEPSVVTWSTVSLLTASHTGYWHRLSSPVVGAVAGGSVRLGPEHHRQYRQRHQQCQQQRRVFRSIGL